MGSMEQNFVMISDSMEKHGEHGTAFSHGFRQHGKAWEAWQLLIFMTLNSMEKHGTASRKCPLSKLTLQHRVSVFQLYFIKQV